MRFFSIACTIATWSAKPQRSKYGDQVDQHPIGTGPYKFVSWQRDANLVLTRNEDYWNGKMAIKEIVIKTRQGRLRAGRRA